VNVEGRRRRERERAERWFCRRAGVRVGGVRRGRTWGISLVREEQRKGGVISEKLREGVENG